MDDLVRLYDSLLTGINVFNTLLQFVGTIILLIAALYIFNYRYIKMLLTILEPIGYKKSLLFKTLILCRVNSKYSATVNIRKFCEYMILKSQGHIKNASWWRKEYRNFVAFYNSANSSVYAIENLSEISCDEELEGAISKYFTFLYENRKRYDLNENHCNSFELILNVKYGLVSTNFLISGLLKTYKDDWNVLINKYIHTINNEGRHDSLYTAELSYTFVWLLWGPSYQLVEEQQAGGYKIAQYSFGDESNSFHLIIPSADKCDDPDALWENISTTPNGIVYEMTCKLCLASEYINKNREFFSSRSTYYLDKIVQESTFILEAQNAKVQKGFIADNYYCTAYVWIIFYSENTDGSFHPNDIVAFFEHANQVDKSSYDTCVKALMAKTFAFFDDVLTENKHSRKYQYLLSMNQGIELEFSRQYFEKSSGDDELSQNYEKYLNIDSIYVADDIFEELDHYFSGDSDNFKLIEIKYGDKDSLVSLGEYYTSIHIHECKDKNKVTLDYMLEDLKSNKELHPKYHVVLSKDDEVIAGIICDYNPRKNHLILKSFLVKEEYLVNHTDIQEKIMHKLQLIYREKGYIFIDKVKSNTNTSV
ncbi:MAG: hypothetical protein FWC77_04405 [Defluviitaleaceae bacterium]|nr:hypothetical protein [Defluviitaleaceae bacterium]